ncbi:nuclear transport factor 2 family protein [Blastococcus sp. SYSU D00820]
MTALQTTRTLEDRIAALEAVAAIERLKYRYWRACDAKDAEAFRACFIARGADLDYGPRIGRYDDADGLVAVFSRIARATGEDGRHLILDMHHGLHPDITLLDPLTAVGRWTLRFRQINLHDRTEKLAAIEYDDRYVVEDGEWKMAKSHAHTLWSYSRPLADGVAIEEDFR